MKNDDLSEQWPTFDGPANIYRVDPSVEPFDDLAAIAERAGVSSVDAEDWTDFGPLVELESGTDVFSVYRPSRAIQFTDTSRWQIDDGTTDLVVSDEDAYAEAERAVERLGLNGGDTFQRHKVTRLNVASAEKGQPPTDHRVIDVGVVLIRVIDGLPVLGQGGGIVVYLDGEYRVTGFERVARRIAGVHEPVRAWRDMDDVLREVESYWHRTREQGLEVRGVRIGYLELGRLVEQTYIQPVYALDLLLPDQENGDPRTVEHFVAAATNNLGGLMPTDPGPPSRGRQE